MSHHGAKGKRQSFDPQGLLCAQNGHFITEESCRDDYLHQMASTIIILFLLLCGLGVASLIARRQLKRSLKQKNPEACEQLALDASRFDRSPRDDLITASYIVKKSRWLDYDDTELLRLHQRARRIDLSYYVVFAMLLAVSLRFFLP